MDGVGSLQRERRGDACVQFFFQEAAWLVDSNAHFIGPESVPAAIGRVPIPI